MPHPRLLPGDPVRVRGCEGIARVEKYIRKYGVYLLDRQMSVRFQAVEGDAVVRVAYWTFERRDLRKVVMS